MLLNAAQEVATKNWEEVDQVKTEVARTREEGKKAKEEGAKALEEARVLEEEDEWVCLSMTQMKVFVDS